MACDIVFICGCMLGIEFPPNDDGVWCVVDVLFVRFIIGSLGNGKK